MQNFGQMLPREREVMFSFVARMSEAISGTTRTPPRMSLRSSGLQVRTMTANLIRVTRRQIPRDLRAFLDVAADRYRGGGRAGAVGLLKTVIAAVEAGDHAGTAFAGRGLGIDQ